MTRELGRALTVRAIAGDAEAFREIYERNAPAIYWFLRDLLRDEAAADEATQEVFVRAHGKLGSLRDPARLSPWLFGIARRVYLEIRRTDRSQQRRSPEAPVPEPRTLASPEALLLGREADVMLAEALATLPPRQRAALMLRMDHDLSYEAIAEAMGWTLATVKIELHRARQQLRARLAGYLGKLR